MSDEQSELTPRTVSTILTLPNVISIMMAVLAVSAAFFTYDTRISVLEAELANHTERKYHNEIDDSVSSIEDDIHVLRSEIAQLRIRLQMDEVKLEKVQVLSRELDNVTQIQSERVVWARKELNAIKIKIDKYHTH